MTDGKLAARQVWGFRPTGAASPDRAPPGTPEFFDHAYRWRCQVEQPWLPRLIPFASMRGKRVLEVGHGPGFDAYTFMTEGANYSGIDITPQNVVRTRQHLGFFGLTPDVQEGDAENLPFGDGEFDVVYSNGVLHHVPDMDRAFREAHRVLKPGGRFFVILYNRRSIAYAGVVLSWLARRVAGSRKSLSQARSAVEHDGAGGEALVRVLTTGEVRRMLAAAGFNIRRTAIRKLLWSDLPLSRKLGPVYRLVPTSGWSSIGRLFGWYIITEAYKRGPANIAADGGG